MTFRAFWNLYSIGRASRLSHPRCCTRLLPKYFSILPKASIMDVAVEPEAKRAKVDHVECGSQNSADSAPILLPEMGGVVQSHVLREPDVGITEYVKSAKKFFGLLKERCCDFLVHEIRRDGSIVHLTSYDLPKTGGPLENIMSDSGYEFSEEETAKLQELVERRSKKTSVDIVPRDNEKATRKAMHHTIRYLFPNLISEMVTLEDGSRVIRAKYSPGNRDRIQFNTENRFLKFVMHKENFDTKTALGRIAWGLSRSVHSFQTSGLKDRRGITTQEVTVSRVAAEHLTKSNNMHLIKCGNYSYTDKALVTGLHGGNHFTIVLRHFEGTEDVLTAGMRSLADTGFINYFGMQRFGSSSSGSHFIGRALMNNQLEDAVDRILGTMALIKSDSPTRAAYNIWKATGDAEKAKACLSSSSQERDLYSGIAKHGKDDLRSALGQVAIFSLYLHAYQSWIWNRMASYRIKEYGLQPVVGDLVLPAPGTTPLVDLDASEDDGDSQYKPPVPEFVTEDNIGDFTIHNVVLPISGSTTIYPKNSVADKYREALAADGVDMDKFPGRQNFGMAKVYLCGSYRHVIVKPTNVSWKLLHYNDPLAPLAVTDLDRMAGKMEVDEIPAEEAKYKAARVEFSLRTSCYATMAIREVCRIDTSQGHQRNMSKMFAEKMAADKADDPENEEAKKVAAVADTATA
eukprot:scpid29092/ scgid24817/ Pseudouridylate synthase 7 homolog